MAKAQNKKTTKKQFKGIEKMYDNFPFICFIALLTVIYISVAHGAEKKARKIQALQSQVEEVRWQYEDIRHRLIYQSTQSQLAERLKEKNLNISTAVPRKLKD